MKHHTNNGNTNNGNGNMNDEIKSAKYEVTTQISCGYVTRFISWNALLKFISKRDRNHGAADESQKTTSPDWYGTRTLSGATDLAVSGWDKGLEKIKAFAEQIADQVEQAVDTRRRIKIESSFVGGAVNVGRFVQGQPKHMIGIRTEKLQGDKERAVRIGVQCWNACGSNADAIMRRGSACAALIDELETMGFRCELDAVYHCNTANGSDSLIVNLKRSEEPVSLAKLAFALAHPSSFRRICFATYERYSDKAHSETITQGAYGQNKSKFSRQIADDYDVCVDATTYNVDTFGSDKNATNWIVEQIKKINASFADDAND